MVMGVETATTFQIDTEIGRDKWLMTVLNGEIARVIKRPKGEHLIYYVDENSDWEFSDTKKVSRQEQIGWTLEEEFYIAKYERMPSSDFEKLCKETVSIVAKHNLKELRNLYKELKDGPMKELCREYQKEMLALLDF